MANTIGGSKLFIPKPPAKGSFPLDHYGECKHLMKQYTECLRETGSKVTTKCQSIAREYLECPHLVPLLSACPNPDVKYNQMIRDHIDCRNSCRSIPITIRSYDNRIYNVFIDKKSMTNNTVSKDLLRISIERDMSIQCQMQARQERRYVKKFFLKINWKRLWQRYDLIIVGQQQHQNRINLRDNNSNEQLELYDNCCMEFISKC
ncbi:chch domain containing protein [Dermatophagoides farinae]|uniref:Chch domain containing protein n=1 Tax=Dermatophagoides farinae TaxID=6954 RepID=A0A9D4SJQ4_DERFA|nr:chch domain containing protein [Dermatophagoides farinae]